MSVGVLMVVVCMHIPPVSIVYHTLVALCVLCYDPSGHSFLAMGEIFMVNDSSDIQLITSSDERFPSRLRHAQASVTLLYARGDVALLQRKRVVAVVGTRKPSSYGLSVVRDIVAQLVAADVVTVSGLAFGIDAAVHRETLAQGGETIAVLGSPIEEDEMHPQGQRRLAHEIVASGGLLLTEYPTGTPVYKTHFPQRNRIIAGCSDATVVVEAPLKSGALITARLALRYNRGVVAVPGSVYAPLSLGCNNIIREGAVPLLACDHILDALGFAVGYTFIVPSTVDVASLHPLEQRILTLLKCGPQSIDALLNAVQEPPSDILSAMTALELRHLVSCADHDAVKLIIPSNELSTPPSAPATMRPPRPLPSVRSAAE